MTKPNLEAAPTATRRAGAWQAALLLAGSCMPVMGSVLITSSSCPSSPRTSPTSRVRTCWCR